MAIRKADSAIRRANTPDLQNHFENSADPSPLSRLEREIVRRAMIGGYKMTPLSYDTPAFGTMDYRRR